VVIRSIIHVLKTKSKEIDSGFFMSPLKKETFKTFIGKICRAKVNMKYSHDVILLNVQDSSTDIPESICIIPRSINVGGPTIKTENNGASYLISAHCIIA